MPIRRKLLLAFGTLGGVVSIIAVLAVVTNSAVQNDIAQISHASVDEAGAAAGMEEALNDLEVGLLRAGDDPAAAGVWRSEKAKAHLAQFEKSLAQAQSAMHTAVRLAEREGKPEEIAEVQEDLRLIDSIAEKFARFKELLRDDTAAGAANAGRLSDLYDRAYADVSAYREISMEDLKGEIDSVEKAMRHATAVLIYSAVLILVGGGLMAWLISRSITRPLGLLTHAAGQIAQRRFDTRIAFQSRDEIGLLAKTFNQMTEELQSTTVSKDYLDSILKSMVNALIVAELDGTIQSVNAATIRMLGYAERELIGMSMDRVIEDATHDVRGILEEVRTKGTLGETELSCRTKDGNLLPVNFSAALLHDVDDQAVGMVCVALDISARKKAEKSLEEAGRKLLETSRKAGMAEVASSVLHNVGNVLNSVNVSSSMIAEKITDSKAFGLERLSALLQAHADNLPHFLTHDPKGKLLPGYLRDLAAHVSGEKKELLQELELLQGNIQHIKEIVGMQQSYARISGVREECAVTELVEDALRINSGMMERHGITLIREYSEVPAVFVEKHKVLQILVNLLRNAKYACDEAAVPEKKIVVRIASENDRLKISVIDNGIGIPAENLTRIFNHGFTTKKDGHGFGLHSGALAAQEMGGRLHAESAGVGSGAAFILDLPMQQKGATNET